MPMSSMYKYCRSVAATLWEVYCQVSYTDAYRLFTDYWVDTAEMVLVEECYDDIEQEYQDHYYGDDGDDDWAWYGD